MVQATFTRQKRELAKANAWIDRLRGYEIRKVTFDPDRRKLTEVRESWVEFSPEEIAAHVLEIVVEVVGQHGARQRANSRNTGRFVWQGVTADLTVPQLRALQEAHQVLSNLVQKLPKRNPRMIPNATIDGRPAFEHPLQHQYKKKVRYVPFEESSSTRVRTYEEPYEELEQSTQVVEIDFGLDARQVERLQELTVDLGTAIQVAIDEANAKGHETDPVLNGVIDGIRKVFRSLLPPVSGSLAQPAATGPMPGRREFL
jgi:hypothetical protein